jgi:hypothetical protein
VTDTDLPVQQSEWMQATVDELVAALDAGTDRDSLLALVQQCRLDLAGVAPTALPELVYRLARQRLDRAPTVGPAGT